MPAALKPEERSTEAVYSCTPDQLNQVFGIVADEAVTRSICSSIDVGTLGATGAVLRWTVQRQQSDERDYQELIIGLDSAFIMFSAYQVFMMQAGFALYAAGVVRAKNVILILLKNFMDCVIACISFWLIGYGFAFGQRHGSTNGFIGNWDFALSSTGSEHTSSYANWFWNFTFCCASTTILSGSIAERATFHSYLIYSFVMTTWVYPVVAHWLWSPDGWLSPTNPNAILGSGAIDFSGSGVVHMVGGFASIVGSIAVGPRTGRFGSVLPPSAFKGNSPPLYLLGTFLLWFGWYGFNPGSNLAIHNYELAERVTRTAVITTLGAGSGATSAMFLSWRRTRTWDLLHTCTGALAGLVSITSGCSVMEPWAAVIAGSIGAVVFTYGEMLVELLQVDDPVGAFPVHGLCGMWGLLFTGLLAKDGYISQVYHKPQGQHLMGIFYGGHAQLLLCQFIAICVIIAWTVTWMAVLFYSMRKLGILRVPLEMEAMGLDKAICGDTNGLGGGDPHAVKFSSSAASTTMLYAMGGPPGLQLTGNKCLLAAYPQNGFQQVRFNGSHNTSDRGGGSGHGSSLVTIQEGMGGGSESDDPSRSAKAGRKYMPAGGPNTVAQAIADSGGSGSSSREHSRDGVQGGSGHGGSVALSRLVQSHPAPAAPTSAPIPIPSRA